jgi:hypothetical protein
MWYNKEVDADSPRTQGFGTGTTHGGGHRRAGPSAIRFLAFFSFDATRNPTPGR